MRRFNLRRIHIMILKERIFPLTYFPLTCLSWKYLMMFFKKEYTQCSIKYYVPKMRMREASSYQYPVWFNKKASKTYYSNIITIESLNLLVKLYKVQKCLYVTKASYSLDNRFRHSLPISFLLCPQRHRF